MTSPYGPMRAKDILELYFIDNRARLLDVAAFLDRIDRYPDAEEARADFRYQAMRRILDLLQTAVGDRAKAIQLELSDPTHEPLVSATGNRAYGAWNGGQA